MIEILRAADRRAQPWKNGGGVTREVIAHPPGCGIDDFGWRLSIADVAEAGPFSRFEGVDRLMAVIEGTLALQYEGQSIRLAAGDAPLAFPGDVATIGTPVGGAVHDLNLMTRRNRFAGHVEGLEGAGSSSGAENSERVLVASTSLLVETTEASFSLGAHDALRVGGGLSLRWQGSGYLIEIRPI